MTTTRQRAASSPPVGTTTGLSPARSVLENGLVVLAKTTRKTPAVSINVTLRTGTRSDPVDGPGAMHLLARVIDRGTATRSASQIADALDSRGISLTVGVSRHLFSFVCTCLSEDFEPVLGLIAEMLVSPSIPPGELATRKGEVVTAIRQDEDSPYVRAGDELLALLYGRDHPYGRPVKGSIAAVEAITRERLTSLHAAEFAPADVMAVVVGDVETDRARDVVAAALGGWKAEAPSRPVLGRPVQSPVRRRAVIPMMNKSQADVAYGFTAITRSDPEYYAFQLLNNVLGQYALGGRLGDSIRERQGMAYYVSSGLEASVIEGPLVIRAGVSAANVDRTISSIDEELRRIRTEPVTPRELNESRQFLIGAMPRSLETNAGIAGFLQTAEFFALGHDHDLRLPGLLNAVTVDQVHAAAERVLDPDRATVVVAGPYQENS